MNSFQFRFAGQTFHALPSGALWWPKEACLTVSDLHLCKSERYARRNGTFLPPFETDDTLARLAADISETSARMVICLGDSFDDPEAAADLSEAASTQISTIMAGRRWVWIAGNHDPGSIGIAGEHQREVVLGSISFRHIAEKDAKHEISGHYHPKASLPRLGLGASRPCFLVDKHRMILPAFGTYTGGLRSSSEELTGLMQDEAIAILLADPPQPIPMPRAKTRRRALAKRKR